MLKIINQQGIQIKAMMRYHCQTKMAIIIIFKETILQGCRATAMLILVGMWKVQPHLRNLWQFHLKMYIHESQDPEISHLNIYQREKHMST